MSKDNFTPSTLSFEDIIDNSKKYVVPKYQRDYSWNNNNDEWDLLWDDIISKNSQHYVGILVLQDIDKAINIIDGQQRLTTLTIIILAALYIMSESINAEKDEEEKKRKIRQLEILCQRYIGKEEEDLKYYNKITLNKNNNEYFSDICNIPKYQFFNKIKLDKKDIPSNQLLYKALKYFYGKVKDFLGASTDADEIISFIRNNIGSKLVFTTINVNKEENAYLLFETLNSRSVELTAYDLLKNHLLSKAGTNYEQSMLDDLEKIVLNIGEHDITKFVALDWNSCHTPKIAEKRIYREVASEIRDTKSAFAYISSLKESSKIYKIIKNCEVEDKEEKEYLKIFSYFPKVRQHYMILISLFKNKEDYSVKKILKCLLNIAIRYNYIAQGQANRQETIYNKIACQICEKKYSSTDDIIRALKSSDLDIVSEEFISKFVRKDFNNEALDRYILAQIELFGNDHDSIDYENETIEHISDKKNKQEYLNKIGNLTLLTKTDNNDISNFSYDQKKEFYGKHSRKIVNMIKASVWNEAEVNKRSNELAEIADKIFR